MTSIVPTSFGSLNNEPVEKYTLTNLQRMKVGILNYGATVSEIITPDKNNIPGDVVLGFNSFNGFLQQDNPYFGSLIGRYANRIANGRFLIGNKAYELAANNNGNSLHGGKKGFDKVIWKVEEAQDDHITLSYLSADGEEGYPGNLNIRVTYTLTDNNELQIAYRATTDQPTPVNLTNHSYFNLSAGDEETISSHILSINADKILEVNDNLIPTGKLLDVKETAFDFTAERLVGQNLQQVPGGGYDHNWVLNDSGNIKKSAASVYHPASGRFMEVFTTEPGLQFYTGNFLDGTLKDTKGGRKYTKHAALCLEAQHFPDSPNRPSFPNTILKPGETYKQVTIYKFGVK